VSELLRRSSHISRFQRRGALFLYHDLFGYLLEGSADIAALIDAFAEPRAAGDVIEQHRPRLPESEMFVSVLQQTRVLVHADTDELAPLLDRYPVRARWTVMRALADGRFEGVIGRNTTIKPRIEKLDAFESKVWSRIDGETTVSEIAEDVGASPRSVARTVAAWTHSDRQWTRTSDVKMSFYGGTRRPPPYLNSTMPFAPLPAGTEATPDPFESGGIVDLGAYHEAEITDADDQFDSGETTLSHMFRQPHPAFAGRSYGAAFADALVRDGLWTAKTSNVVEVGGGVGFFAAALLDRIGTKIPARSADASYTIVELSPALQASQRGKLTDRAEAIEYVLGNAEVLELPDGSVDLLISNEVVADFRTARVDRGDLDDFGGPETTADETLDLIDDVRLPIDDADDEFFINLGAMRFVQRVAKVLKPGGVAVITEFGDQFRYPVESVQLDHPEFSIHFGHLAHVAAKAGLATELKVVPEWLGMDPDVAVIATARTWHRNLAALFASDGVTIEKIAYTRPMLAELAGGDAAIDAIDSIRFEPAGQRACGLRPHEFKALIVRKPS